VELDHIRCDPGLAVVVVEEGDADHARSQVCELPLRDRPRFNNLAELEVSQQVRVCGRWVRDRLHGHNELHPVSSIDVLS
jgi:hypothetical protein